MKKLAIDMLALAALAGWCYGACCGAPAPFARAPRRCPVVITTASLEGTWRVQWGSTSPVTFHLEKGGAYSCPDWPGAPYRGSWGVSRGYFWLVESAAPERACSWTSYAIRLDPRTMQGEGVIGCAGVKVRLQKVR